jgi:signal transduction histidine kinase
VDDIHPPIANSTYNSYAEFPLIFSNQPIGALKLLSRSKDFFSVEKQFLIQSYTNLAAVAIQNTWLFDEVRMTNRQLHALSQRLMKVQEEERLQLSRELHDESGQLLAALTVQLGLLERDSDKPVAIRARTVELKQTANMIQENLHRLAVNLRPASLDHLGLVTTLQQNIQEFSRQYSLHVDFEAVGMRDKRLPIEIETALFRIVQEALTNVVLHAQATRVDVLLSLTEKGVSAIVEDDGVGFVPATTMTDEQIGLFGMRERIEMLGGTLTIESSPGKGTTVKAEAPYRD